ncbi:MAG TPA: NAD(+) synthase [Pirellulales bacterium]|jgi:NAD+ synthase (glutamine-hydrolysing)|nr:NAD(+) synthase [Pirellulales bacterium]
MQLLKVGAAVLNQTPLAWDSNKSHILAAIRAAREQRVSVLCLPELCISGYGCEDAFLSPAVQRMALTLLGEILPATQGLVVSLGLPLLHNNALYNTACLVADGRILGFTAKRFLAGDGIHYEPRWFKPWPVGRRASAIVQNQEYPLGDIYFDVGGIKIGFEICEDAWVANRPGSELARRGVDVILNPSASHFAFAKAEVRRRFVLEGSRAFAVSYVYANLLGNEAGRAIYDGGALIATAGQLLAAGPRFSFAEVGLTTALVDIDATRMARARSGSFAPEFSDAEANCIQSPFSYPTQEFEPTLDRHAAWELGASVKEEEFTRAIALALFDYLRKSRSRGFVVSLSGGADSAAVSCLIAAAVQFGVAELGLLEFAKRVEYILQGDAAREGGRAPFPHQASEMEPVPDARQWIHRLLTCVYQSTRNSGNVTRSAARGVAEALGTDFIEFDVDALVQQYIALGSQAEGRPLDWETDDLALQNIQARVRAPSVWLLANVRGALLVATSNRSEAAVGYATMDGDTSGGISPIAGIDKAFLRRWLAWYEAQGPEGIGPLVALSAVNQQQPTAELRPSAAGQTDEADLMPYELLDAIERAAIRDKRSPLEVFKIVQVDFPQYSAAQLLAWVERFFRLWCRNQWKRERYAPSFHVDDENLDPKTWCRFPILSGGFERELAELRAYVNKR